MGLCLGVTPKSHTNSCTGHRGKEVLLWNAGSEQQQSPFFSLFQIPIKEFKDRHCNSECTAIMAAAFLDTVTEGLIYISQWHLIFVWAYNVALNPVSAHTDVYLHKKPQTLSKQENWTHLKPNPEQLQIWIQNLLAMHFAGAVHYAPQTSMVIPKRTFKLNVLKIGSDSRAQRNAVLRLTVV